MPLYEYKCGKCGHSFEKYASGRHEEVGACPQCGKDAVEKVFSTFSSCLGNVGGSTVTAGSSGGGCGSGGFS